VVFTSDGKQKKEIDVRVGIANAVLCELYRSVVTKREILHTAKLSVSALVILPTLVIVVSFG